MKSDKWIQEAVKHEGRVRRYIKRIYGDKAFFDNGKIKIKYIDMAIEDLKKRVKRPKGLLNALYLAKRFKKVNK